MLIKKGEQNDMQKDGMSQKLVEMLAKQELIRHSLEQLKNQTETKEELEDTIRWGEQLTKDNAHVLFNIFAPFPGTPLYGLSVKSGFKEPKDLESWGDFTLFDWFHHHPSWLDKKTIDYLTSVSFAMLFNNSSMAVKITNPATRMAFKMYSPIAKFRLKHRFFNFYYEKKITDLLDMNSDF